MRKLTKIFSEPSILRAGVLIMALAFISNLAAPVFGKWFLYVAGIIMAVGNGLTQPSVSAHVSKCAPPTEQGTVLGTNQSFASLARVVGPFLAGVLYDIGVRAPFTFATVGMILAFFIALPLRPAKAQTGEAPAPA